MSNTIPPLVCDTPPPIDSDHDDDFGGFESHDSTFATYDDDHSLPTTPKHISAVRNEHGVLNIPVTSDLPPSSANASPKCIIQDEDNTLSAKEEVFIDNNNTSTENKSITLDYGNDDTNSLTYFSIDDNRDDSEQRHINEIVENNGIINNHSTINVDCSPNEHNSCNETSIELDLDSKTRSIPDGKLCVGESEVTAVENDGCVADGGRGNGLCDSPPALTATSSQEGLSTLPPPIDDFDASPRIDSPPSLELSPEKYSDNDECDINVNENAADGHVSPPPFLDDDDDDDYNRQCELNINAYDDTTSLPSLKLDSMRTTPAPFRSEDEEFSNEESGDPVEVESVKGNKTAFGDANEAETETDRAILNDASHPLHSPRISVANEFAFEADFSQFSAFESAPVPDASNVQSEPHIHRANVAISSINQISEDDFDDFENFQAAKPLPVSTGVPDHESSATVNDEFGAFSDFKVDKSTLHAQKQEAPAIEADDDDFGDFSEFQHQAAAPPSLPSSDSTSSISSLSNAAPLTIDIQFNVSKIKPLLDEMFPTASCDIETESMQPTMQNTAYTNEITTTLKDVENSKALDHQWISSSGKNMLVKALGIDSRNILYGEKWNSSMPRFAANLGFTPLEPMKPTSASSATEASSTNHSIASTAVTASASGSATVPEVPAAQFDWNSSGLVNPLDGDDENGKKSNPEENQPARHDVVRKSSAEAAQSDAAEPKEPSLPYASSAIPPELSDELSIDESSLAPTPISASYMVPGSGTLKETHIFTPSKAIASSSAAHTKDNRQPAGIASEQEKSSAGIVINEHVVKKEYRDVVYEPDKLRGANKSDVDDFSEFQSVEPTPIAASEKTVPILNMPYAQILEPVKAPNSIVINWPDPGNVNDISDLHEFSSYRPISDAMPEVSINNDPPVNGNVPNADEEATKSKEASQEYSKPVIGVSPSEYMFSSSVQPKPDAVNTVESLDDEFSDFQSIPPPTQEIPQVPASHMPDVVLHAQQQPAHTSKFILPLPDVPLGAPPTSRTNASTEPPIWQQFNGNYGAPAPQPLPVLNAMPMSSIPMVPLQSSECLQPEVKSMPQKSNVLRIDWPDPGIDPDEMARLEALFPQPKTISQSNSTVCNTTDPAKTTSPNAKSDTADADDEWSDFVSVTQPQLPITNILNHNLQKHQNDDDDWSDFVSSTGPAPATPWTTSAGPNFAAWNSPTATTMPFGGSPSIFQSSTNQMPIPPPSFMSTPDFTGTNSPQHHSNGFNNSFMPAAKSKPNNGKIQLRALQNKSKPSIISMPDLGFVAPKTLMNMPRNNFTKK